MVELNKVIRYLHEHNKRSTTDLKLKVRVPEVAASSRVVDVAPHRWC